MGVNLAVQLRKLRRCHGAGRDAASVAQRLQHRLLPPVVRAHQRQRTRHIRRLGTRSGRCGRARKHCGHTFTSIETCDLVGGCVCGAAQVHGHCQVKCQSTRLVQGLLSLAPCTVAAARLAPMAPAAAAVRGMLAAHVPRHQPVASEPATPDGRPPPPASATDGQVRRGLGQSSHMCGYLVAGLRSRYDGQVDALSLLLHISAGRYTGMSPDRASAASPRSVASLLQAPAAPL